MIIVHTFGRFSKRLSSVSPFVLKLETWLRLAGIPHKSVGDFNPFTAPRGKAPWVTLEHGTELSDSALIIAYLRERPEVTIDDHLTEADRARHTLIQRVIEDHLYWCVVHERWKHPPGFAVTRIAYFRKQPAALRPLVAAMARRTAVGQLQAQGTGRHKRADILASAADDFDALLYALGDAPFFGGERPATIDATVYGALANIAWGPFDDDLKTALADRAPLMAWLDRVFDRAWAEESTSAPDS